MDVLQELMKLRDEPYRLFTAKLIPTVPADAVIGVRVPDLRALAKIIWKEERSSCADFMQSLPHRYLEENHLHAFLIESIRDYDEAIRSLDAFLPYVNNWATTDLMSPKTLLKRPEETLAHVRRWIAAGHPYTVRFGIGVLLNHYLDARFQPDLISLALSSPVQDYYVQMMKAWYLSMALVKQWDAALPYLLNGKLPLFIHNKSIQKAVESRRVSAQRKDYLKGLRRKI